MDGNEILALLILFTPIVIIVVRAVICDRRYTETENLALFLQETDKRFAKSKLFAFQYNNLSAKSSFILIAEQGALAIKTPHRDEVLIMDARDITGAEAIISESISGGSVGYLFNSGIFLSAPMGSHRITKLGILFDVDDFDEPYIEFIMYSNRIGRAMIPNSRAHIAITVKITDLLKTLDVVQNADNDRKKVKREFLNIQPPKPL